MTLPKFPTINQELLNQLRGLFFSKDQSIVLPNYGFIGLSSIDTPSTLPPFPYRFVYVKADGCVYILDWAGNEYKVFSSDIAGNLFIDGNINITGEYQINSYNNQKLVSIFQDLPGHIGIWYGGRYQRSTGNMPNLVPVFGGTNRQDLTLNGNPTFNYLDNGTGYVSLDGTGDFFSSGDNTDLDVLGTETIINATKRGMTAICWCRFSDPTNDDFILSKYTTTGNQRSWYLRCNNTGNVVAYVDQLGTNVTFVSTGVGSISDTNWHFLAMSFFPASGLLAVLDNVSVSTPTAVSSIFNSTAPFLISGINAGTTLLMTGDMSIASFHSMALSASVLQSLYQKTRSLYGV